MAHPRRYAKNMSQNLLNRSMYSMMKIHFIAFTLLILSLTGFTEASDKLYRSLSDSYLTKSLKMDPSKKSVQITKNFQQLKEALGEVAFSKKYHMFGVYESEEDVWIYHYINKDSDGKPKVGNGSGMAKILLNTRTKKVIGVWLMPK